ncbi:MAG TPA: molybdopterin molybdotransferase MoeA, partial [Chitinispirillaceae bacterium]|nr:molybdopterin molybdotransferase MoeA [Chitinispirillaceae bacterium]
MITFQNALDIIRSQPVTVEQEIVSIYNALDRVLAEDVLSDIAIPPFDVSAMDGFACKRSEKNMELHVIETIAAGQMPQNIVESGTCARIMTGAMIPEGADSVVMFEHTHEIDNKVRVIKFTDNLNIRYRGEDASVGDLLLSKGTMITSAACAVLATAGRKQVIVAKKPLVGIIATGNELVEPDVVPSGAHIRNSNSYQLFAQALRCSAVPEYFGIADDTIDETKKIILKAENAADLILISGGVSAGDFDCVPSALKECGYELLIQSVAVKPGKPTVFGRKGNKFVFGLPGNPVSNFVLFELFVRPFICALMGNVYKPLCIT